MNLGIEIVQGGSLDLMLGLEGVYSLAGWSCKVGKLAHFDGAN